MEFDPSVADAAAAPQSQGAFNGGGSRAGDPVAGYLQSSTPSSILSTPPHQSSSGSGGSGSPTASDPGEAMAAMSSEQSSGPHMSRSSANMGVQLTHVVDVVDVAEGSGAAAGAVVGETVAGPLQQRTYLQTREECLRSLQENIPHRLKWENLKKEEKRLQKEGSAHKKVARRLSKELYVILSWYVLLQSGVFAAVGQTSLFECDDWWRLVMVVATVTAGTIMASVDKLHRMGSHQREVVMFEVRQNAVYDVIVKLRTYGANHDLNLEPAHRIDFDAQGPASLALLFSPYGLLVLLFLLGFSALNMVCCVAMLCSNCQCHAPSPSPSPSLQL